jgi:CheY-like chemotaxis protein
MADLTDSKPRTILIADDYEDNRELLRLLLVGANYEVREASNGTDCLAMALEHPPDLILVDLSMPGMDGWRVLRELKNNPQTASIPCMAVTASETDRARAQEIGFNGYLSKPFRSNELFDIVSQILSDPTGQIFPSTNRTPETVLND